MATTMRALLARAVRQGRTAAVPVARWSAVPRTFSSKGLNGLNGLNGDHALDGDDDGMSPLERLLQHSQRFRDEAGLAELPEGVEDEILGESSDDDNDDDDHEESFDHDKEEDEKDSVHRDGADDDTDLEAVLDERAGGHAEFVGQIRKPHGRHHDHDGRRRHPRAARWGVEQRVRRAIGGADDVDFEHGLRDLDERRAREKLYLQLLARDYDRDRVCQNCGEPGHVARNCMLPVICSNCGDVGHRRGECPHRAFSVEQLRATTPPAGSRKKSESQRKAEARRRVELQAIRERHERMKQAFDDEMDEYLDHYERVKKSREDKARQASEPQE